MLFGVVYLPRKSHEAARSERSLGLFTNWQPPVDFKDHWNFATGGGIGLIEARTSAALARSLAPFKPFFDFRLEQVDHDEEAVPTRPRVT
jgi:hypothetical protein